MADRLGHVEHEAELERGEELGVEDATVVVEVQVLVALPQLRHRVPGPLQPLRGAVDAHAVLHGALQRVP